MKKKKRNTQRPEIDSNIYRTLHNRIETVDISEKKKDKILKISLISYISRSASYSLQAKSSKIPVFENKILQENNHAHSYMFCPWLLLCYNGRIKYQNMEYNLKSLRYCPLQFGNPWFIFFLKKVNFCLLPQQKSIPNR